MATATPIKKHLDKGDARAFDDEARSVKAPGAALLEGPVREAPHTKGGRMDRAKLITEGIR